MARKPPSSSPPQLADAPPDSPVRATLAARYLDFWQRNLLAWSNDIVLPSLEERRDD